MQMHATESFFSNEVYFDILIPIVEIKLSWNLIFSAHGFYSHR